MIICVLATFITSVTFCRSFVQKAKIMSGLLLEVIGCWQYLAFSFIAFLHCSVHNQINPFQFTVRNNYYLIGWHEDEYTGKVKHCWTRLSVNVIRSPLCLIMKLFPHERISRHTLFLSKHSPFWERCIFYAEKEMSPWKCGGCWSKFWTDFCSSLFYRACN